MPASNEDDLIARYFRPLATSAGSFELRDDAAILGEAPGDIVVTTDAIVEGVHFFPSDPPETIARKALRVNLSDLAAKGAAPAGFVLTLALPQPDASWLESFAGALGQDAALFQCPLLGGDTVSTPGPRMISITAFGRVKVGRMVRRLGAQAGDVVAVTGTIGDAVIGLDLLKGGPSRPALSANRAFSDQMVGRYRVPQPRIALASAIADCAHAAMDVSDGLAGDLAKLCSVSGVSARIDLAKVPLSEPARTVLAAGAITLEALVGGGDDYEVVCTVPATRWPALAAAGTAAGVAVTAIGEIVAGSSPPVFLDASGRPVTLTRTSYSHF